MNPYNVAPLPYIAIHDTAIALISKRLKPTRICPIQDSKSEGVMLKETTNINKSLFVLGKVRVCVGGGYIHDLSATVWGVGPGRARGN